MANWKYELAIKDCLIKENDLTTAQYRQIASNIYERIATFVDSCKNDDISISLEEALDSFEVAEDAEAINDSLELLYDVCDWHRIWVK